MTNRPLDKTTRRQILALVQANCAGRDDLYAAAEALGNDTLAMICRRLAGDLADNAVELQQMARAAGMRNVDIHEFGAQLQADLMEMSRELGGDRAVMEEANECEEMVRREYDQAIEQADDAGVEDLLRRQREKVRFGEQLARRLQSTDDEGRP